MKNSKLLEIQEIQYKYSYRAYIIKLGIISFLIIGGFILTILGINGSIEIAIEATTIKGKIINASPGIIFVLLGSIVALNTHYIAIQNIDEKEDGSWNSDSQYTQGLSVSKKINNVISQSRLSKNNLES